MWCSVNCCSADSYQIRTVREAGQSAKLLHSDSLHNTYYTSITATALCLWWRYQLRETRIGKHARRSADRAAPNAKLRKHSRSSARHCTPKGPETIEVRNTQGPGNNRGPKHLKGPETNEVRRAAPDLSKTGATRPRASFYLDAASSSPSRTRASATRFDSWFPTIRFQSLIASPLLPASV